MIKVIRGNSAQERRKKIIKLAKKFMGASSRLFKIASQKVMKSFISTYSRLKRRRRNFKRNWICRINGATRKGLFPKRISSYNKLRNILKKFKSKLNVKMVSQMSILDIWNFFKYLWVLNPYALLRCSLEKNKKALEKKDLERTLLSSKSPTEKERLDGILTQAEIGLWLGTWPFYFL